MKGVCMKIAVDAMGGDNAPHAIISGAMQAAREFGVGIILVGANQVIQSELDKYPDAKTLPIEIRNATEVVDKRDSPSTVYRRKKDSSIRVANELVKNGEAIAVVSAGPNGAAIATSLFMLGSIEGVERPALAFIMPTVKGTCIVLDVGANLDCKPSHLLQFAVMGDVLAKHLLNNPNPRVGLLSIGEEETKGNELTKEVFKLLTETSLNFSGNVEGRDVLFGKADVVVCDGFLGNVLLKVSEAVANTVSFIIRDNVRKSIIRRLGYIMMQPFSGGLEHRIDYAEHGGAFLVGMNGISIIGYSHSSDKAVKNAIRVAAEQAKGEVTRYIHSDIQKNMRLVRNK